MSDAKPRDLTITPDGAFSLAAAASFGFGPNTGRPRPDGNSMSLAFVAEDRAGVGGYIVAALDSRAFGQRLESDWWPALRTSYPEPTPGVAEQLSLPERRALGNIHHPWDRHDALSGHYPSHLHIDLLPRLQGRGLGRQLIATLTSALRHQGSPGVHLLAGRANQRAAGFYRHVGFTELPATDVYTFAMELGHRTG